MRATLQIPSYDEGRDLFKSDFLLLSGNIVRMKDTVFRFETDLLTQSSD